MRYLLAVVTHGRSPDLRRVLNTFRELVTPSPVVGLLYIDGPDEEDAAVRETDASGQPWIVTGSSMQRGFCASWADAWDEAAEEAERLECDYVFWLENDFVFRRPVDLEALAHLLDAEPDLAQVAFMRNACNAVEAAAGGLYESRLGEWDHRSFVMTVEPVVAGIRMRGHQWLRHSSYFTTNPSLMRTSFMLQNLPPDDGLPECEGRFGIDLVGRGYGFGVWGSGEPWVEHVGVRTGFGY